MLNKPDYCQPCVLYPHNKRGFSIVSGTGEIPLLVCAEASGRHEERLGRPLIEDAPAGKVFQKALDVSGLSRDVVSLTNVLRCRPPGNDLRGMPYERAAIDHCRKYLDEAVAERKPNLILALGDIPLRELSTVSGGISELRGFVLQSRYEIPMIACVDPETECLTVDGWRSYSDLTVGQLVAVQNDKGNLEWQPLDAIHIYPDTETPMLYVQGQRIDMCVSPDHKCVVRRQHVYKKSGGKKRFFRDMVLARNLKSRQYIPLAADWEEYWDVCGAESITSVVAELLGWYIAEGSPHGTGVRIYQSRDANPENCSRIERLLRESKTEYSIRESRPNHIVYGVYGEVGRLLRTLSPNKQFPEKFLLWSRPLLEAFYTGLHSGDGSRPNNSNTHHSWHQKDPQRLSDFQALCARLGWVSSLEAQAKHKTLGNRTIGIYKSEDSRWRGLYGKGLIFEWRPYKGTIWCPQTPSGTWVARRNGKVFITGNSYHPSHLARGAFGQLFGAFLHDIRQAFRFAVRGIPEKVKTNYVLSPTPADVDAYLRLLHSQPDLASAYDTETEDILGAKGPKDWREKKLIQIQFSSSIGEALVLRWEGWQRNAAEEILATPNMKWGWNDRLSDRLVLHGVKINGEQHDLMNAWAHLQPSFASSKDDAHGDKDVPAKLMSLQSCLSFYYPEEGPYKGMVQAAVSEAATQCMWLCAQEDRKPTAEELLTYMYNCIEVWDVLKLYGAKDADYTFRLGLKLFSSLKKLGLW